MQDLEQIEYRKRMIEKGMKTADLPVKVWRGAKIPAEVRKAVNEENLLNLGGVYGDKRAGDPVKYDHLKLVLTDDMTEGMGIPYNHFGVPYQSAKSTGNQGHCLPLQLDRYPNFSCQ
jgi:hypothetical protein